MTFGFSVTDQLGKKLFTPSGKCYVLYRVIKAGAGKDKTSYHDTGIYRATDPTPLCFVRSTERYTGDSPLPLGCMMLGKPWPHNDATYIITAENTYSTVYVFMPGYWVEAREGRQTWGARFYDEDGEVSYCGWQKPLTIDGFISQGASDPQQMKRVSNAILMRAMGSRAMFIPSINPSGPTIFYVTSTAYNGRSEPFFKIVGGQGGGASYLNSYKGDIPYIDSALYEQ
ncbi:hypothetical protein ABM058_17420 [Morganella morganii]